MKLRLVLFSVLLAICQNVFAQCELPFREIIWEGVSVSGFHQGEQFEYFLLKRKVFAGISLEQERAAIQDWSTQYSCATAVPVSIIGEKSQLPLVFVWAIDGSDNLNVYLVRNGVHSAIGMLETAKFDRLLQASASAPFVKRATQGEGAGNPTGVTSRRLISQVR